MSDKVKTSKKEYVEMKSIKNGAVEVDDIFNEAQEEINEKIRKEAKQAIKSLLEQKASAEKVLNNINRQIAELKLKLSQELK